MALALLMPTALLAVPFIAAIVVAIALITAIVSKVATIVSRAVTGATSGAFVTATVVRGRSLEGRSLLLLVLFFLLYLLERPSPDVGRVVGRKGRKELGGVARDLFVVLGIFFLPCASTRQERSLVELHSRGDGQLVAQVSPRDKPEDRRPATKELGRGHRRRLLVVSEEETNRRVADVLQALHFLEIVLHDGREHTVVTEGGLVRSFRELAESRRRPLVEHLLPDVDGDALEALRQKRQEEPVVPARRRVQPIDDVRLEHRECEGQKELRARALVGDDVADHVLVDVGPLDGRRVLDLDLIRLLQRRRIALFLALPRGEVIEGRTRQRLQQVRHLDRTKKKKDSHELIQKQSCNKRNSRNNQPVNKSMESSRVGAIIIVTYGSTLMERFTVENNFD